MSEGGYKIRNHSAIHFITFTLWLVCPAREVEQRGHQNPQLLAGNSSLHS